MPPGALTQCPPAACHLGISSNALQAFESEFGKPLVFCSKEGRILEFPRASAWLHVLSLADSDRERFESFGASLRCACALACMPAGSVQLLGLFPSQACGLERAQGCWQGLGSSSVRAGRPHALLCTCASTWGSRDRLRAYPASGTRVPSLLSHRVSCSEFGVPLSF